MKQKFAKLIVLVALLLLAVVTLRLIVNPIS